MVQVQAEIHINAPIEKVWSAMTHHEGMVAWPDFYSVDILEHGHPHRNGVGCIRKVSAKGLKVTEEIKRYDAPHQMDYQVIEINHPIIHHGGTIALTTSDHGTLVKWTSKLAMKSKNPLIRYFGAKMLVAKGNKGFRKALVWVKKNLEHPEI